MASSLQRLKAFYAYLGGETDADVPAYILELALFSAYKEEPKPLERFVKDLGKLVGGPGGY